GSAEITSIAPRTMNPVPTMPTRVFPNTAGTADTASFDATFGIRATPAGLRDGWGRPSPMGLFIAGTPSIRSEHLALTSPAHESHPAPWECHGKPTEVPVSEHGRASLRAVARTWHGAGLLRTTRRHVTAPTEPCEARQRSPPPSWRRTKRRVRGEGALSLRFEELEDHAIREARPIVISAARVVVIAPHHPDVTIRIFHAAVVDVVASGQIGVVFDGRVGALVRIEVVLQIDATIGIVDAARRPALLVVAAVDID